MIIDTNAMISITEANQNFSKVTKIVDELGNAVILKNNTPRYLVIDFSKAEQDKTAAKRMRNLRNDKAKSETNIDDAQPIDKGNRRH